ncbi:hypothetical protein HYW53_03625 [Candidatus Giovannonibacteria bacterium]|nr:hypothetical protein [Candidatus Giovannonibacteria bacterium]
MNILLDKRILGGAAILISVFVAGYFVLNQIQILKAEVRILKSNIALAETKTRNVKAITNTLDDLNEEKEMLDKLFITDENLVHFIEDLEEIARLSGINLKVTSATGILNAAELGPSFQLEASGSFSGLLRYSFLLENMPYQMIMDKINFRKEAGESGNWKTYYTFRLISYIFSK